MQPEHLTSFIAVAEELHFGRAAQRLGLLPASLGRHIRLLEESLAIRLFERTTRSVALTEEGSRFLAEIRPLMRRLEEIGNSFRTRGRQDTQVLRVGAIDSASAGLVPLMLRDFREIHPGLTLQLTEAKSEKLITRLQAGGLDLAIIRPRPGLARKFALADLGHETPVVALPAAHPLALRRELRVSDLVDLPLIVPDRRSRPHSYDLTFRLFDEIGALPRVAQVADEKQTILSLVVAGIGAAIIPRSSAPLRSDGLCHVPLADLSEANRQRLPLALIWMRGIRDPLRDDLVRMLIGNRNSYLLRI